MRLLAIGDIHGCATAFQTLLDFVKPTPGEQFITLGDYVDRGPDSKGVIERLIGLNVAGQLRPLRGNHEVMMLGARQGGADDLRFWLTCGGVETLESYSPTKDDVLLDHVPDTHWHFMKHTCCDWYETGRFIFVHANLDPQLPLERQTAFDLQWEVLSPQFHVPHYSGKTMICGHTEQRSGVPLVL